VTDLTFSALYPWIHARQLEGTYSEGPSTGAWITSAKRIARGWGSVTEDQWPYETVRETWPPHEPRGLDELAKPHRIFAYQRVRSVQDARAALALKRPVCSALEANEEWGSAENGDISLPNTPFTGAHTITLVGYDDRAERFNFINSWGAEWGDEGYGSLPYTYFDSYGLESWTVPIRASTRPPRPAYRDHVMEFRWGIQDLFSDSALHGMEFFDCRTDECIAWSFVVLRDGYADIEELFVRPAYRQRGYGKRLATELLARSREDNVPLRLWVPHPDAADQNEPALTRVLDTLGLALRSTDVRWAAAQATSARV
jgi:GNAT superfamily N-acetyltransferase